MGHRTTFFSSHCSNHRIVKESISSFLVITAFLLAAGLLSSCSTPRIATYELGAYTLSLPQKNIDANTTAEYQADLVAGQTLQFRFLVTKDQDRGI